MQPYKSALLLIASSFVFGPAVSLAQAPEPVQAATAVAPVARSHSEQYKAREDERTRQIEAVRSDIADLSKFEHGNEYLPKSFYKRDYAEQRENAPVIAECHERPNYGVEHHM